MSDRADQPNRADPESSDVTDASPASPEESSFEIEALSRPRRRIRWRRLALVVAGLATLSIALGVTAFAAATVYPQYGAVKDGPNAQAWRAIEPRFAGAAACTTCHGEQAAAQDASAHVNVSCEDCHGPGAAHGVSDDAARAIAMRAPSPTFCDTCHATTAGRPGSFPQIDPARHYSGGVCLRCHDPHSIVAVRPPVVTHPLANLPVCTTCHSPDGLKQIPEGHELVADATCLACHGTNASGTRPR